MNLPKIDLPTSEITLPSGVKTKIRPFTVKEEKILLIVNGMDEVEEINNSLRQIIHNCTFGEVDSYKLPMVDMEYLFISLRKMSVGDTVDYIFTCPKCKTKFEGFIDLNEVQIKNKDKETNIKLTDNVAVQLRFPTQMDENNYPNASIRDKVMNYTIDCIEKIYVGEETYETENMNREEVEEYVDSLPGQALEKLVAFFLDVPFCFIEKEVMCPRCKATKKVNLEGMSSFFLG